MNENEETLAPVYDLPSLVDKVEELYKLRQILPPDYRRELVVNAHKKIKRWGRYSINLQWSHNEAIMLERLYNRFGG